ncbi:CAP domain-containing protein [Pseudotamlana haliotis]|nr:CAP domain-containing protein [Tamlana haliotis]
MKTTFLKPWFALVCMTMLIFSTACSSSDDSNGNQGDEKKTLSTQLLNGLNDHRLSLGLDALILHDYASTLAQEHSEYMAEAGKMSYDNSYERAELMFKAESPSKMSESAAWKYNTAEEAVAAMLNASEHKNNIEADFTHIGIGTSKSDAGIYFYSLIFLRK